jgi:hypothetical protein
MSLHINRFIDRIKAAEGRNQRDLSMTLSEARDLHADITKILLLIEELRKNTTNTAPSDSVELDGGSF